MSESNEELEARLKRLEDEARALRAQIEKATPEDSQDEAPAESVPLESSDTQPTEAKAEEPEEEVVELTPEQVQKADSLLQRYKLEKTRQNHEMAARYLAEAKAEAPNYTYVVECEGDELVQSGKRKDAIVVYKRAFKLDSKNVSAEKKHADLVFSQNAAAVSLTMSNAEAVASAKTATILSVMIPGLGQVVTGNYVKGGILAAVWVMSLAWMLSMPNGLRSLPGALAGRESNLNPLLFVGLGLAFVVWLGSVIDMQSTSKAYERNRKHKAPPKPPVDLPH